MAGTEFVANSFNFWKWEWHKYICQRKNPGSVLITTNVVNNKYDCGRKTDVNLKQIGGGSPQAALPFWGIPDDK